MLKILFICSGTNGISTTVSAQAASLAKLGVHVDFFPIQRKGVVGYLKHILPLRKVLWRKDYDVIHAHYSLSAYVASMAGAEPLVVSLMGSDTKMGFIGNSIIHSFRRLFQWQLILKAEEMNRHLNLVDPILIPNGVDLSIFKPANKIHSLNKLNWSADKKHLLFAANPARQEKNYAMAQKAVEKLNSEAIELHYLNKVPHSEMPIWYNAADIVLLTSLWEGSPNAIKEAMACNRPIVSTDVGDVHWLFGGLPGHFISDSCIDNFSSKVSKAIEYSCQYGSTNGRQRIIDLSLDSENVAKKLMSIYLNLIPQQ